MAENFKIMFVCFGNTCRSPMAEGAMRKLLENKGVPDVDVYSSGTSGGIGFEATPYAVEASKIWEADISTHRSQPLTEEIIDETDLILAMETSHCQEVLRLRPDAGNKVYLLKKFPDSGCGGDGVDDPIGGSLDMYNQTFLEIGEEIGRILPGILDLIKKKNLLENDG
ncbi:MAG: low molecular weight protein arginine phosphatase [candidate division Zixibacteria bacterium]|nr:low molecular weight protein arginine phosphatase [candidate division Zixibacteria bacterium]